MRSLKEVKEEMNALVERHSTHRDTTSKQYKKDNKQCSFLKQIVLILEKEPTKSFMVSQLSDVQKQINIINRDFGAWEKANPALVKETASAGKNIRSVYNRLTGIKELNQRKDYITYVLAE